MFTQYLYRRFLDVFQYILQGFRQRRRHTFIFSPIRIINVIVFLVFFYFYENSSSVGIPCNRIPVWSTRECRFGVAFNRLAIGTREAPKNVISVFVCRCLDRIIGCDGCCPRVLLSGIRNGRTRVSHVIICINKLHGAA